MTTKLNKKRGEFNIIILICLILLPILLPLISSAPPQAETIILDRGVDIVHPETLTIKLGNDIEFNFWTYNSTTGETLTNSSLNCTVYFINSSGVNFFRLSNQPNANGLIRYGKGAPLCVNCWTSVILADNFSLGQYSYQLKCQGSTVGGYSTSFFQITETGNELPSSTQAILYSCLILILIILTLSGLFGIFYVEDIRGKFALYWTVHLLTIAVTFILWNVSGYILYDDMFIESFFRITFLLSIISFLPMFMLSIFFIIKHHFINKTTMDLINAGYDRDDAERIALRAAKNE